MDWTLAITRNRDALLRVLAMLFAMAGLQPGAAVAILPKVTLPRHLRIRMLRLLRPAESATRRLISVAARDLSVPLSVAPAFPSAPIPCGVGARLPSFALSDPRKRVGVRRPAGPGPRLSIPGIADPVFAPVPPPGDAIDATRLFRRLGALKRALEDLPAQARRLARRRHRHARAPLRPGRPPGYRARPVYEVDDILAECHALARYAHPPPI